MRTLGFSLLLALTLPAVGTVGGPSAARAAPSAADPAAAVLACDKVDFQACPALLQASASRGPALEALVTALQAPATPVAQKVKAATALAALDARERKDALHAAAQAAQGTPEHIDFLVAAARLGDERTVAGLRAHLTATGTPRGRLLAAGALGLLRAKEAVADLLKAVEDPSQPRMQAEAARALGLIGDSAAEPALMELAGGPKVYGPARAQALEALAALHSERAVVLATQLVDFPARDVGRAALRLIAAVPQPWSEPAVLFGLETPGLRGHAARAAVAGDLKSAGKVLLALIQRDDLEDEERREVLHAIGQLKPPGAGPALVQRLKTAPPPIQVQILKALPQVGDKTVVPELVPLLRSQEIAVVHTAVYALENLTGRRLGADEPAWRRYVGDVPRAADSPDAGPSSAPPDAPRRP